MRNAPRVVLASGSPRRLELLQNLGLQFTVQSSDVDEYTAEQDPAAVVVLLSLAKARAVADKLKQSSAEPALVLGADTIVVLGAEILGKPTSTQNAYEMLMSLSGKEHKVYTGVSIVEVPGGVEESIFQASSVFFRKLSAEEARFYAESGEPMDKAGAYALQGIASAFVEKVDGCYSNIIGLPVPATVRLLRRHGVRVMGALET